MKIHELKNAYTPVSAGFHAALLSAVSEVKEEQKVRRISLGLVAALLAAAMLCTTAAALISHYSVRDYQAQGNPDAAFERRIVDIAKTFENDRLTLTIGDAIFDGERVALTMNLYSKDEGRPVFLYPTLTGFCGERKLDIDVEGMRGLDISGFLYPNLLTGDMLDHRFGIDAALYEDAADGDVTWTFTMQVLSPNWPIINDEPLPYVDQATPSDTLRPFSEAYANGQILSTNGDSLVEYAFGLPAPDGMSNEAWQALRIPEKLVKSGAFSLLDTYTCTFVTAYPVE